MLLACLLACLSCGPCLLLLLLLLLVLVRLLLLFFLFYGGSWVDLAACCCSPLPSSLSLFSTTNGGDVNGGDPIYTQGFCSQFWKRFLAPRGGLLCPRDPALPNPNPKNGKKLTCFLSPRFASLRALYSLPRDEEKGSQFQSRPVMPQSSPPPHLHTPHTAGSRCCCCCSCTYKSFYLAQTQSTLF